MFKRKTALRFSRRLLACVLALVMVLAATPIAFAADNAVQTYADQQGKLVSSTGTYYLRDVEQRAGILWTPYQAVESEVNQNSDSIYGTLSYTYVQMSDNDTVNVNFYVSTDKWFSTLAARMNSITPTNSLASSTTWSLSNTSNDNGSNPTGGFDIDTEFYQWVGSIHFPAAGAGTYTATFDMSMETWNSLITWFGGDVTNGTATINITVLDKRALVSAVDAANALLAADDAYLTADSKAALENALAVAQPIAVVDYVTDQATIDNTTTALNNAIQNATYQAADKTQLVAAMETAAAVYPDSEDSYAPETWAPFAAAYKAAAALNDNTALDIRDQATIDAAAQTLLDAFGALKQVANYTVEELNSLVSEKEALLAENEAFMTKDSIAAMQAALEDATAAIEAAVAGDTSLLDNAYRALEAAVPTYTPAVYDELNAALADAKAFIENNDLDNYDDEAVAAFQAAVDTAAAMETGLDSRYQTKIDAAAQAILDTMLDDSDLKPADYSALNSALDEANALLNNIEEIGYYYEDAVAALQAAVAAADEILPDQTILYQAQIDAAAQAIKDAMLDDSDLKPANYDELNDVLAKANAVLADSENLTNYSDEAVAALQAAVAAADEILPDQNSRYQCVIDAAAQAIKDAMLDDSDLKPADITALTDAIAAGEAALAEEGSRDNTVESLNELRSALYIAENLQNETLTILDQAEVTAAAEAIYTAINGLTLKPAVYTALEEAIAQAEATYSELAASGLYTDAALQAYAEAIDVAKQVNADRAYNIREQAQVDAAVATLNAAVPTDSGLKPADLSALNAAIEAAETAMAADDYNEYTEYTRQALESALAAARELANANPTILQQNDVAQAAEAVTNAINALVKAEADYTALDAVIATAEVKLATNLSDTYTLTSIAALQDAVNNAKAIDRHLPSDQQATVDNAAQAIKDAINGLQTYTNVKDAVVDIVDENGNVVEGDVLYVKAEWWDAFYTNVDTTIGVKSDALADDVTITWEYANWSVDDPEANITASADGMTANVKPNGKGVGARSCWVKVTLTDANGNTAERIVKVRFYKFDWQK